MAKATTTTTTNPLSPAAIKAAINGANAASGSAETPAQADAGVSTAVWDQDLFGHNDAVLGAAKAGTKARTAGQALTDLLSLKGTKMANIQKLLASAKVLTGKYVPGQLNDETKSAIIAWVRNSVTQGESLTQYIGGGTPVTGSITTGFGAPAVAASTAVSTTSDPTNPITGGVESKTTGAAETSSNFPEGTYSSPATNASDLQNAYMKLYGIEPTDTELQQFQTHTQQLEKNQFESKYQTAESATIDPTTEATIFAEGSAGAQAQSAANAKAVKGQEATITKVATSMGTQLAPAAITSLAQQAVKNSWSADQVSQAVAKQFKITPQQIAAGIAGTGAPLTGDAATLLNDMTKLNGQYMTPNDNSTMANFIQKEIQGQGQGGSSGVGTAGTDEYENYLRQQASILYPGLSASTAGFTTATPYDATSSIRSKIAGLMGYDDPTSVDLTNPTWSWALNGNPANPTAPPDMQAITQRVMTDPNIGWNKTAPALGMAYQVSLDMLKNMGALQT